MRAYEMVDDPATDAVVSWGPGNNNFAVWNTPEFWRMGDAVGIWGEAVSYTHLDVYKRQPMARWCGG
ncbi:hypothetical protein E2562_011954 [Oryza meyeriana var. granulata]|uniref:HSF-type DNA-binding domain-containing protein n=1 Tax=Oryza meyeriana var. granulata TaxID=110450 RepID=A0A6G1F6Y5_9ORYZ|nr:hypothetical protein E2562_011954 [Oryza meyeriana var. granulata]